MELFVLLIENIINAHQTSLLHRSAQLLKLSLKWPN